jgi:hypothetical protein
MRATLESRLRKLETAAVLDSPPRPAHRLICDGEDPDTKIAELVSSGQAHQDDTFIVNIIVHPKPLSERFKCEPSKTA